MVRSCFVPLALWGGFWALYAWLLSSIATLTASVVVGGFTGLMVLAFLGVIVEGWNTWRYRRAVTKASRQEPLVDGRLAAVVGEILPDDEPARTPFSGEPCILCEYSIKRPRRDSESGSADSKQPHFGVDVSGYVMNPCLIRSSHGDLRLVGFPQLDGFGCRYPMLPSQLRAARELVEAGEFDVVGLRLGSLLRSLNETYTDDDGHVRRKFRLRSDAEYMFEGLEAYTDQPDDIARRIFAESNADEDETSGSTGLNGDDGVTGRDDEQGDEDRDDEDGGDGDERDLLTALRRKLPTLAETIVAVGATVCAVGVYSSERRALVPRVGWRTEFTRLYAGDAAEVEARLRTTSRQKFLGGLFALIVVHAILVTALVLGNRGKARDKQANAADVHAIHATITAWVSNFAATF